MKRSVFVCLFLSLFVSSFVVAASSEIDTVFLVNSQGRVVENYVPSEEYGFYWVYFVLVIILLVSFYFVFKNKGIALKRTSGRKGKRLKKGKSKKR